MNVRKEYNKLSKREKQIVDDFTDVLVKHRRIGVKRMAEIIKGLFPIR